MDWKRVRIVFRGQLKTFFWSKAHFSISIPSVSLNLNIICEWMSMKCLVSETVCKHELWESVCRTANANSSAAGTIAGESVAPQQGKTQKSKIQWTLQMVGWTGSSLLWRPDRTSAWTCQYNFSIGHTFWAAKLISAWAAHESRMALPHCSAACAQMLFEL